MKIGTRMGDTECGMRAVNRSRRRSRLPAVVRSTKEGPPECDRITTTATITEYEWRGLHRPAPRAGDAISRERERELEPCQTQAAPGSAWCRVLRVFGTNEHYHLHV